MKKITYLFAVLIGGCSLMTAQNTVVADAGATFLGYANVSETPANGGAFVFGSGWDVPDLKTVVDAGAGTITLQPNFNTYDAADPFWVDPATGNGNKIFEGNTFVEDNTLAGSELTFTGGVQSFTLDPGYVAIAFIKVFNADFTVLKQVDTPMTAGQDFSVTYTEVAPGDTTVQYGWSITGVNANPADEAALGGVVIVDTVLSTNDFDATSISSYPNPVLNDWNVTARDMITSISVVNVLGQEVIRATPSATNYSLDMSALTAGVYVANVTTAQGEKTIKLIKK